MDIKKALFVVFKRITKNHSLSQQQTQAADIQE